jgi:hypothetical membrane protein
MSAILSLDVVVRWFGLAGTAVVLLAVSASASRYSGRRGERYSVFNHFVSELGERGVSPFSGAFNVGLIVSGALLLPCCVALGMLIPGAWAKIAMLVSCVAAVSVALVGVFPMNDLPRHTAAAMTFFRAGLLTILLFGVAIVRQPAGGVVLPFAINLVGALAVVCYAAFLILGRKAAKDVEAMLDPLSIGERPRVWILPTMEWGVFLTTMLWFSAVALSV